MTDNIAPAGASRETPLPTFLKVAEALFQFVGWGILFAVVPSLLALAAVIVSEVLDPSTKSLGFQMTLAILVASGIVPIAGFAVGFLYGTLRARGTPTYGYILIIYGLVLGLPSASILSLIVFFSTFGTVQYGPGHEPPPGSDSLLYVMGLFGSSLLVSVALVIFGVRWLREQPKPPHRSKTPTD